MNNQPSDSPAQTEQNGQTELPQPQTGPTTGEADQPSLGKKFMSLFTGNPSNSASGGRRRKSKRKKQHRKKSRKHRKSYKK